MLSSRIQSRFFPNNKIMGSSKSSNAGTTSTRTHSNNPQIIWPPSTADLQFACDGILKNYKMFQQIRNRCGWKQQKIECLDTIAQTGLVQRLAKEVEQQDIVKQLDKIPPPIEQWTPRQLKGLVKARKNLTSKNPRLVIQGLQDMVIIYAERVNFNFMHARRQNETDLKFLAQFDAVKEKAIQAKDSETVTRLEQFKKKNPFIFNAFLKEKSSEERENCTQRVLEEPVN